MKTKELQTSPTKSPRIQQKKQSKWRKHLTVENFIFLLIYATMLGYLGFQSFVLDTSAPQVSVTTTSMVPTYQGFQLPGGYDILRGDLLIVQNKKPTVGDTIVFNVKGEDTPIVHRIVAEYIDNSGKTYYGTKGDNNGQTDFNKGSGNQFGWIPEDQVIGVIIFKIPFIGWFALQIQNDIIRFLLLTSIVIFIGLWIHEYYKNSKKSEAEKIEDLEVKENEKSETKQRYQIKWQKHQFRVPNFRLVGFTIILLIFLSFAFTNLIFLYEGKNTLKIEARNNMDLPTSISLTGGIHTDFLEEISDLWIITDAGRIDIENIGSFYIYNMKLTVSSHGFYNSAQRVTIITEYAGQTEMYEWNIVYSFKGEKSINAGIILVNPSIPANGLVVKVTATLYSSGLFAQPSTAIEHQINATI